VPHSNCERRKSLNTRAKRCADSSIFNPFDGYEGLARVYAKTGRLEEARILMDHALELASHFVDEGESGPIGQFASRFASKTRHDGPASRNRCSDPTAGRKNGRFARKIASKQE